MVEDVLVHENGNEDKAKQHYVLILVVVEDVLVLLDMIDGDFDFGRLNPCCGGRCSSTLVAYKAFNDQSLVLILVVVEDVLVRIDFETGQEVEKSLNPCCGGRCSSTT